MKKCILITTCLFILTGIVDAQEKKSALKFSSINSVGLLSGQSQTSFTMQTINGVKYKTWFTGIGQALIIMDTAAFLCFLISEKVSVTKNGSLLFMLMQE